MDPSAMWQSYGIPAWRRLPAETRQWTVAITLVVLAVGLFFVDRSLGYALALTIAVLELRKLPLWPLRIAGWAAIVVLVVILAAAGAAPWSLVLFLAAVFAAASIPPRYRGWALPAGAIVAAIMYPFYYAHLFTLPVFGSFPDVPTGVYMVVFIMMAVGLNIVVGYAGLLDLGYVAFYATGAYTTAWFASAQFAGQKCPTKGVSVANCNVSPVPRHSFNFGGVGIVPGTGGFHVSIWILLALGGVITALFGILIGLPTLRLRGDYLAIVTLGFGEILPQVARNGDNFFGTGFNLTNGPNGITPLDAPGFGHRLSDLTGGFLPANYLQCCNAHVLGHAVTNQDVFFWTAIVLLLFTVFCSYRLQFSRLGRAWIAIREDETAAAAMGVPLMRTKTWAYASGAFFGGIAGAFYASFKSSTFPGDFFFNISVFILCMVILGGMGNIWGVIVGAGFLSYLNVFGLGTTGQWINTHIHFGGWHPNIDTQLYQQLVYGVIIVAVMLFRPEGLIPSRRRAAEWHEGVHDEPLYDHEVAEIAGEAV